MSPAPIALTCGEVAGIGPELAHKAWEVLRDEERFFVIGSVAQLRTLGPVVEITSPDEAEAAMAVGLPVLDHPVPGPRTPGVPQAAQAQAVIDIIARGVSLTLARLASGLVTLPIHKAALAEGAGFAYPGHTEYLADLGGVDEVVMMLAADTLRVVPVTIHIAL